jgi:putative ABC transport system ATP-binding protein
MQSAVALQPGGEIAVSCRGVTKSYGSGETKIVALRGIDLDVMHGELLMIAGPSGCGKTTLISVITTILSHDAGQCHVLGRDLQRMDERARAYFRRKSIGFVFQLFNLLPALTAAENVAVPLLIEGVPWESAKTRANELLRTIGLGARAASLPASLSGGQQQRVAIARAVVHDPALLICDEPTSNLDHQTGHAVMEMLRGLTIKSDRTVIVVTHDPRIFEFADRVARMDDGRITEVVEGKDRERLE